MSSVESVFKTKGLKVIHFKMDFITYWRFRFRKFFKFTNAFYPIYALENGLMHVNFCWAHTHDVAWRWTLNVQDAKQAIADLEHYIAMQDGFSRKPQSVLGFESER